MKHSILIIDDEVSMCTLLSLALSERYQVQYATSARDGLELLEHKHFDLVLLDLMIGSTNGIDVLKKIRTHNQRIPVIMMTAFGSISTSVEAVRNGAFNYLVKPLDMNELTVFIEQALSLKQLNDECDYLADELKSHYTYHEIVGRSEPLKKVFEMIEKLKDLDTSVVIYGESGTGKELAARAFHQLGRRKQHRFVAINCAAIPENLMEGELFGHKRGSFTGALQDKKGKLEVADKGILFLDEIGDMPLSIQGKLLRVLQQKEFSPLGSNEVHSLDIRVLAATNRNLEQMVQEGLFRQDLYYRLNVVNITMPPLRDRKEDIPLLCNHFLQLYEKEQNRENVTISPNALKALLIYDYPGNVRQLANILEYAMILAKGNIIEEGNLPDVIRHVSNEPVQCPATLEDQLSHMTINEVEKLMIQNSLKHNNGRRDPTAKELGISLRSLFNKIQKYDI